MLCINGSKRKYVKDIIKTISNVCDLPIIEGKLYPNLKYKRWIEPFVGGCNVITSISDDFIKIGNDKNEFIISLFKCLQIGWTPEFIINFKRYNYYRSLQNTPNLSIIDKAYIGFCGVCLSYGGKWFGGYARTKKNLNCDYIYGKRALLSISKNLSDIFKVIFTNMNYVDIKYSRNDIIYCDPPYYKTENYKDKFDSVSFWKWANMMYYHGYKVFVSEYLAPKEWKIIWQRPVYSSLTNKGYDKVSIETLYTR